MDSSNQYNIDIRNIPLPLDEKHSRPPEGVSRHLDQTPSNSCKYEDVKTKTEHLIETNVTDDVLIPNQTSSNLCKYEDTKTKNEPPEETDDVLILKTSDELNVDMYRIRTRPTLQQMLGLESENESEFVKAVNDYKELLSSHVDGLPYHLMRDVISKDAIFITANYKRIAIGYNDTFLDIMEQILLTFCQVIRNYFVTFTSTSKIIIPKESRRIKILLQDCLLNRCDRITNVLMSVRVHPNIDEHKVLWGNIFMYFLVRIFTYRNEDDIARGFILFQKLIEIRPAEYKKSIEDHMNRMLGKRNLSNIAVINEMRNKKLGDPLCSTRDLYLIYQNYKSRQEEFGGFPSRVGRGRGVSGNDDMFSRQLETKLRLSGSSFFQDSPYSNSPFAPKLTEWPGVRSGFREKCNGRWDDGYAKPRRSNFSGREANWAVIKKTTTRAICDTPSAVIVIDDDDDDDDVQICSEPITNSKIKTSSEEDVILIEPKKEADKIEPTLNGTKDGANSETPNMEIVENLSNVEVVQASPLNHTANNQRIEETLIVKDNTETTTTLNGITKTLTGSLSGNNKLKENAANNLAGEINTDCHSVPVEDKESTSISNTGEIPNKISSELEELALYSVTKNNGQNGRRNGQNLLNSEASRLLATLNQWGSIDKSEISKTRDSNGDILPSPVEVFPEKDSNLCSNGEISNPDKDNTNGTGSELLEVHHLLEQNSTETVENERPKTPLEDLVPVESNKDTGADIGLELNRETTLEGTTSVTDNVEHPMETCDNVPQVNIPQEIDRSTLISNDSLEKPLPLSGSVETKVTSNGFMESNMENSTVEINENNNLKISSENSVPVQSNEDTETRSATPVSGELTLDDTAVENDAEEPMETENHEPVRENHMEVVIPPNILEEIDKSSNDVDYVVSVTDTGQELLETCSVEEANAEMGTVSKGSMETEIEHVRNNNILIEKHCDNSLRQINRDCDSEPSTTTTTNTTNTKFVMVNQKLFSNETEELPMDNYIDNCETDDNTDPSSPDYDPIDISDVKSHFEASSHGIREKKLGVPDETSSIIDIPQEKPITDTRPPSVDPFHGSFNSIADFYVAVGASMNNGDVNKRKTTSERNQVTKVDSPGTKPNDVSPISSYNVLASCNNKLNGGLGTFANSKNGQFKVPPLKDVPSSRRYAPVKKASSKNAASRSHVGNGVLYHYCMEGPVQKPRPADSNGFVQFDWNDESTDDFCKEPTPAVPNGGRVSVVPANKPPPARKGILKRQSSTSKSRNKRPGTNSGNEVTIALPTADIDRMSGEISNEPTLEENKPTYLNYYNNLYLPNNSSSISSSNVPLKTNLHSPVYNHLSYPNPSNLYYDNLQNSSNLFLTGTNAEIDTNRHEKMFKPEEFGAIAKTLNDANAVLDQGSVFCTDTDKLMKHLDAALPPPVPDLSTNSLFEDELVPSIRNFVGPEESAAYLGGQHFDDNNSLNYQHGPEINNDSNLAYPATTMYSAPMSAYYPTPTPEIAQNVLSQNPQTVLCSTAAQSVAEDTKTLPYKKRKMDMAEVKLENDISYPAKRQMSIADLHPDFPKIKTLAARKLYPEGTYPYQNYYYPEEYNQYDDYNKRSVMNVYINGLRECSANYPLCLMIGTVHTCMNNSQTTGAAAPPDGGQCPEQAPPETPPNYDQNVAPAQPVLPANVQKHSDVNLKQPVYEPKSKRSRKTPTVEGPKRSRGRPRKNVN